MEVEESPEQPQSAEGEESVFSTASRTKKIIVSCILYYCTFSFGVGYTFFYAAGTDFSHKFDVDFDYLAKVFSILTGGYLTGALSFGILTKILSRQIVVLLLISIGSTTLFVFPHLTSIGVFFGLSFFLGFFAGGYDTAQLAWTIDIWRHEAAPWILAQTFFYSLGTVVPPLLLSPFLSDETKSDDDISTTTVQSQFPENSTVAKLDEKSELWIPFTLGACILLVGILIQIPLFCVFRAPKKPKSTEILTSSVEKKPKSSFKLELPPKREIILITLSCCSIAFYAGMETCTMQFISTFAQHSEVKLSESKSADILFLLSLAFCIGRGVGIFLVLKVLPQYILVGNITLLIISNVILFTLAGDNLTWLRVGSVMIGAGLSTTFASYFAYIEKYLFISDSVASIILLTGGGVSAIYPIIVGDSVETNPRVMIYVNFISLGVLIVTFTLIYWLTSIRGGKGNKGEFSSVKNELSSKSQ